MTDTNMQSQELSDLYKIRFQEAELPRKNAIWKILCKDYFQSYINTDDTVLDMACGFGEVIKNI